MLTVMGIKYLTVGKERTYMEWRQLELGLPDLANKNSGTTSDVFILKLFSPLVHLKFKFNWASCILSVNSRISLEY